MESLMDMLNQLFGEGGDLAGIASAAGLGGGATSAAAAVAFRGMVMRFIARVVTTGLITGAGFLFLLNHLGFQIVPKEEVAQIERKSGAQSPLYSDWAGIAGTSTETLDPVTRAERQGKRVIVLRRAYRENSEG
jgi:hypothetical protein